MIQKFATALWFAKRPDHWSHAAHLIARKFRQNHDRRDLRDQAREWARSHAVSVADALKAIDIAGSVRPFPSEIKNEGKQLARRFAVSMGGPGDLNLLYSAVELSGAKRVVETGVAFGWSSLAILAGFGGQTNAKLVSVDMPYPKENKEAFVGIVVPDRFRQQWELIREPDRHGVQKAIKRHFGKIDLCHYDSDKSWWGRRYAYPLLWNALTPGGIFISDDIQDNFAFARFVEGRNLKFSVTSYEGKFVGIVRKPHTHCKP